MHRISSNQIQQGNCLVSQDVFVYNTDQCRHFPKYMVYSSKRHLFGHKVCIPLAGISDPNFGHARYTKDRYKACRNLHGKIDSVATAAETYFKGIMHFKNESRELFHNMSTDLSKFREKEKEMQDRLVSLQTGTQK